MSVNDSKKPIILIIDDTPENIDILKMSLINDYTIRAALNGKIALKVIKIRPYPDLVLLDVMMPEMDGYEVCRCIKNDMEVCNIPIIFITACSEENDELTGIKLGAVDYITKPFSIPKVQARIKAHITLHRAKQELDEHNQRLVHEKELIEDIILKMRQADDFNTQNLRYLISPVEKTTGDVLLSTINHNKRNLILLGDFTGHGLPAAIGGHLVSYIFHSLAKQNKSGKEILLEINQQLYLRLPTSIFFATLLLEFDLESHTGLLWNAGLPDALLIRQGAIYQRFNSQLPPLGIIRKLEITPAQMTISLQAGDSFYAFSDGVIEVMGEGNEMFGMHSLEQFLIKVADGKYAPQDLLELLKRYSNSNIFNDDITLLEFKI